MPGITITFAFILATMLGAFFHLIFGGDARRLALYLLAAWIGFGLGHLLGVILDVDLMNIGPLRIVTATIGATVALFMARFLTVFRKHKRLVR